MFVGLWPPMFWLIGDAVQEHGCGPGTGFSASTRSSDRDAVHETSASTSVKNAFAKGDASFRRARSPVDLLAQRARPLEHAAEVRLLLVRAISFDTVAS